MQNMDRVALGSAIASFAPRNTSTKELLLFMNRLALTDQGRMSPPNLLMTVCRLGLALLLFETLCARMFTAENVFWMSVNSIDTSEVNALVDLTARQFCEKTNHVLPCPLCDGLFSIHTCSWRSQKQEALVWHVTSFVVTDSLPCTDNNLCDSGCLNPGRLASRELAAPRELSHAGSRDQSQLQLQSTQTFCLQSFCTSLSLQPCLQLRRESLLSWNSQPTLLKGRKHVVMPMQITVVWMPSPRSQVFNR